LGTDTLATTPQVSNTNTTGNTSTAAEQTATPSADKKLADAISAAMAPFFGQMSQLNENVSLLLGGQDEWRRTVKLSPLTALEDLRTDMNADLSAILAKDSLAEKPSLRRATLFYKNSLRI